ncbi:MAG TPA: hypothetical protein VHI13_11750 [Candidatus Kapabacteria bacterium]|nr:hypothetical protein [Candidatus Kapabacteria bacterium]
MMQTMTQQRIRWCVPQVIADVANSVDWTRVRISASELAAGLRAIARSRKRRHLLPPITRAPVMPNGARGPRIAPDVPQEIIDVFNEIDWTRVSDGTQEDLATELAGFVFANPFMPLPRRHWQ